MNFNDIFLSQEGYFIHTCALNDLIDTDRLIEALQLNPLSFHSLWVPSEQEVSFAGIYTVDAIE
jgi:hypothetical protein